MGRGFLAHAFLVSVLFASALVLGAARATAAPDPGLQTSGVLSLAINPLQEELAIDAMATSGDPGTQHVGPIPSTSPDSGTCGNDWANDTFDRVFTIRATSSTTYTVYEQFKNGSFTTFAGPSPGACDMTDGYGPGTLTGGDFGTMHGYEIINVTGAENPAATCGAAPTYLNCQTTAGFLATFFPGGIYDIPTYFFHYAGNDGSNSDLAVHEWKNASCDRGGNHGDIANATTPTSLSTPCV
jgi:hypothetical protein